jgi:hypothetical protein
VEAADGVGDDLRSGQRQACTRAEDVIDFGSLEFAAEKHQDDASGTDQETTAERKPEDAYELLAAAYRSLGDEQSADDLESRRKLGHKIAETHKVKPEQPEDPGAGALRVCLQLAILLSDHQDDWEAAIVERHLGRQLLRSSTAIAKYLASGLRSRREYEELTRLLSVCESGGRAESESNETVRYVERTISAAHQWGPQLH